MSQRNSTSSGAPEKHSVSALKDTLKKIFALTAPYRGRFFGAIVVVLLGSLIWLSVPLGLRALLDAVFEKGNEGLLNILAAGLLGLFILQAIFNFTGNYYLEWVGERVIADLRKKLYEHLHRLGFRFFAERRLGEITSRLTNDVGSIRVALTDSFPQLFTITVSLVGSVALMIVLNWRLSLVVFFTVPFVTLATRFFGQKIRHISRGIQDDLADSTAVAEDALGAVRLVKAFVREDYEVQKYADSVEQLFTSSRRKIVLSQVFWSAVSTLFMSTLVIIFWYGGREVLAERLSAGDLVAFIVYALNISRSVGQVSRLYAAVNTAAGASERVFELLDEYPEIEDKADAVEAGPLSGQISFKNVDFAYEHGRKVLRDITFTAAAGQTIALVGPSGAGKTTLLNLIPRFYDPAAGVIEADGKDLRSFRVKSYRSNISVVPQDTYLFGATIEENILYGRLDATREEVIQAAKDANAHEFIMEIPGNYEAAIGEKGVKLSGGQRQRIAIARAILKNPKILLLDEATSALDSESEAKVQEALTHIMKNRTTFVIAHRLSTVQNADRILVLDEGRIVEDGTHTGLLEKGGLYSYLYELQFRDLDKKEVKSL